MKVINVRNGQTVNVNVDLGPSNSGGAGNGCGNISGGNTGGGNIGGPGESLNGYVYDIAFRPISASTIMVHDADGRDEYRFTISCAANQGSKTEQLLWETFQMQPGIRELYSPQAAPKLISGVNHTQLQFSLLSQAIDLNTEGQQIYPKMDQSDLPVSINLPTGGPASGTITTILELTGLSMPIQIQYTRRQEIGR